MAKKKSSKIDAVLSYILSNQKNQELIEKKIIYLNPKFTIKLYKEFSDFLNSWENRIPAWQMCQPLCFASQSG